MEEEKWSFKVGDYVQLKEKFIQALLKTTGQKSHGLGEFSYPQKIQAIYRQKDLFKREVLVFSPDKKWALSGNEFRLATEKEIKEHKIRSVFLND